MYDRCWICRQQKTTGLGLLSQIGKQNTISEIIKAVVGIKLDDYVEIDRLVCSPCVDQLNKTYKLWRQCRKSQLQQKCAEGEEDEQYFCRLCAKHDVDELIALACVCDTWSMKVSDMVEFLSGVVIKSDDRLSPYICDDCLQFVNKGCMFKQKCLEAELSFLSHVARKWDMMKFKDGRSNDLVVDLYTTALPRWNTQEGNITHTYCMICSLETPFHLFSNTCNGCRLEYKNFDDIINSKNIPIEIAQLETDSNSNVDEMESDCSIDEEPSAVSLSPKKNRAAEVNHNKHAKPPPDIKNCFEVVENIDAMYQRVRRKGPMCCGCKIFFLSYAELERHREMYHVEMLAEAESCFACEGCGRLFRTKGNLRTHVAKSEQDTFYYCIICEKLFFDNYNFKLHKAAIHANGIADSAEILDKFKTKTVLRYKCKMSDCRKLEKTAAKFQKHYSDRHELELDKEELINDPSYRARVKMHYCKVDGCKVVSISLPFMIRHYSVYHSTQPEKNVGIPPMTIADHKSSFKPEAPDINQFTMIDSIDNAIGILRTDSEFCCGCFTFHKTADDLQLHVSAVHDNNAEKKFAFVCDKCTKGFYAMPEYSYHMSVSNKGIYYYCQPCELFLWDMREVTRHKMVCLHRETIDNKILFDTVPCTTFVCCGCSEKFDLEDKLIEHRKSVHHDPPKPSNRWRNTSVCNFCHKHFQMKEELEKHEAQFSNTNLYKCKVGQCIFETRKIAVIKKHVFTRTHLDPSGLSVPVYNPQPTEYECCIFSCDFVSMSHADVVKHVTECHNNAKSYNAVRYGSRRFPCEACSKGYDTWYQLLNHISKRPTVICKFCGRNMPKAELVIHQPDCPKKIEVGCDVCGKQFEAERLMKVHKKNYHKNARKRSMGTVCNVCGLLFTNIKAHMLTHGDQKPFKCSQCPMGFRSKIALDNHGAVHTKEKAFLCRYEGCTSRYAHATDRFRHERQVHMNIMPFSCTMCSKSFGRDRDLRLHQRMHTGRKLYPCDKCSASFDKLIDLKRHECDDES